MNTSQGYPPVTEYGAPCPHVVRAVSTGPNPPQCPDCIDAEFAAYRNEVGVIQRDLKAKLRRYEDRDAERLAHIDDLIETRRVVENERDRLREMIRVLREGAMLDALEDERDRYKGVVELAVKSKGMRATAFQNFVWSRARAALDPTAGEGA